jgi:AraC-like DNA-binding protein
MQKADPAKPLGAPLLEALKTMQRWLERDGADRLMVAAPTMKAFQRQSLPAHVRVSVKKRKSARVAIKGPRRYRNTSAMTLARWPEDGQEVNVLPTFLCVMRGQMDLHIADYVVHCQPGDVIFIPPGVPQPDGTRPHYEEPYEGKYCDLFWMCPGMPGSDGVECWICHSRGAQHPGSFHGGVCWVRNSLLVQHFYGLAEESQRAGSRQLCYYLLCCILLQARREMEAERLFLPGHQSVHAMNSEASHDPIEQACAYIKSHLNRRLSVNLLARQVALSPTSLTRKFREQTGKSLIEYINAIRLEEAAALLRETEWSVKMICGYVGVRPLRMRQLFHEHHDCSPTEFRRRKIG